MRFFIGREKELARLKRLWDLKKSSLVVIKGRRRVGKSTLVQEFAKRRRFISLTGLAPAPGTTNQKQRDAFAEQLCLQLKLPKVTFSSWTEAFHFLGTLIEKKETVILLDEISWMADLDPTFLAVLKTWWDELVAKTDRVILVLCGSISIWIEENILSSTNFVGRITLTLHLQPLSIKQSILFLRKKGFQGSIHELLKILSVTGGVPWYLDLINVKETADQNIYALCFESASQLVNEFRTIFHDLFGTTREAYRRILEALVDGMKTLKEIQILRGFQEGGTLSQYLRHLVMGGFVSEHYQWSFKKAKIGKQKLYRLSDCFTRFYLKYVEPHRAQIEQGIYQKVAKGGLPGWDSILGFQLENLLLSNREFLLESLGIDPSIVLCDNPFVQKPTTRKKGCQIDYLIQTSLNSLIICEFKFSKREIGPAIIEEMQEKASALSAPRQLGKACALFHVGGVSSKVAQSPFFFRVVDLQEVLENPT